MGAISLEWSGCHIVVRGGGWSQLVGVPHHLSYMAAERLIGYEATGVKVLSPGVVQFHATRGLCSYLIDIFPNCPLVAA
jgi:hypothetical protein